jgi:arsenate reductase
VAGLEAPVADLVRKDSQFAKLGLDEADYTEPDPVIDLLVAKPRLLQRPIVVRDGKAIIGRPKDRVRAFLS